MTMSILSSIPSPGDGTIDIGPIPLHVYGLLLAIGVLTASWMTERRWVRWGHPAKEWSEIVVWIVIGGVVGARLYHVATDYEKFQGDWLRVFQIWKGGLSIWGVVAGGLLAVLLVCRVRKIDTFLLTDAIVPGLLVAQAIGRWGNWFNQELFGEPSTLPWALEIDRAHRPEGFAEFSTFHPTFLYESILCLGLVALLLWVERRWRLRTGQLSALYLATYCFGRFWLENLRIDDAKVVAGLRINAWVSLAVLGCGIAWFVLAGRRGRVDPGRYPDPSGVDDPAGAPTSS
ncbi:MAG: prolipoprotein diacylglyceryl transferase [Acidimicrobiia bacterium]